MKTTKDYFHACTVEDLEMIIQHSFRLFQGLRTIICIKKEQKIFHPFELVFIMSLKIALFRNLLESVKQSSTFRFSRKADIDQQKELERLQKDGFKFIENKRDYEINLTLENVRNTQLYRTLLHEIGHYVQFCEDEERFDRLPTSEKEVFAHNFADKLKLELEEKGVIPFPRQFFEHSFEQNGLDKNDFSEDSK